MIHEKTIRQRAASNSSPGTHSAVTNVHANELSTRGLIKGFPTTTQLISLHTRSTQLGQKDLLIEVRRNFDENFGQINISFKFTVQSCSFQVVRSLLLYTESWKWRQQTGNKRTAHGCRTATQFWWGVQRPPILQINYKTLQFKGLCVPISSDTCYMASEYTTWKPLRSRHWNFSSYTKETIVMAQCLLACVTNVSKISKNLTWLMPCSQFAA